MGVPQNSPICNFDDYLVFERAEEVRREYCDGQIYAMAGESLEHSTISANLIGILHGQLKGKPCRALSPNMKVLSGELLPGQTSGLFSYPDVTVVCGEPKFHDGRRDVLLNPTVIVEVLSPSTESFDRGGEVPALLQSLGFTSVFCLGFIPISVGRIVPVPAGRVLALFGGGGNGRQLGCAVNPCRIAAR